MVYLEKLSYLVAQRKEAENTRKLCRAKDWVPFEFWGFDLWGEIIIPIFNLLQYRCGDCSPSWSVLSKRKENFIFRTHSKPSGASCIVDLFFQQCFLTQVRPIRFSSSRLKHIQINICTNTHTCRVLSGEQQTDACWYERGIEILPLP